MAQLFLLLSFLLIGLVVGLAVAIVKPENVPPKRRKRTPPQVAAMWGISPEKVIGWILAGELRAIDASSTRGGRPRYLIDEDDLADFERRRAAVPAKRTRRQQRRKPSEVTEFF